MKTINAGLLFAFLAWMANVASVNAQESEFKPYHKEAEFPKEMDVIVDFDVKPDGTKTVLGEPIEKMCAELGLVAQVDVEGSKLTVKPFKASKGYSAAGDNPEYEGVTSFTFFEKGDSSRSKKTISHFGIHVAYVTACGTLLKAYDESDNLVGELATNSNGICFLGFYSKTPIARVEIVPDKEIDPDYAFDDVSFKYAEQN